LTCGIPRPTRTQASRSGNTFAFATVNLNLSIISIAVPENVPPDAGLQKRDYFSTLIIGLAGTGSKPGLAAWQATAITAQPSTTPKRIHFY
jgi:hypothetical protein